MKNEQSANSYTMLLENCSFFDRKPIHVSNFLGEQEYVR